MSFNDWMILNPDEKLEEGKEQCVINIVGWWENHQFSGFLVTWSIHTNIIAFSFIHLFP